MILLTVIFIMIVLGLLATFLAQSLAGQHAEVSLSQLAEQARFAATSGMEWGRNRALAAGLCGTNQVTIGAFTVTVTCDNLAVTEGVASYTVFDIRAEARHGSFGDPDFVRRSLQSRVTNR